MTRVEELTALLLDGALDADGERELERLLATDADARAVHVRLIEVDHALRARRPAPDVTASVQGALRGVQREARIVRGVMRDVRGAARPRRRRWWPAPLAAAAAVALLLGALRLARPPGGSPVARRPAATAAAATVTALRGRVTRVRGAERRPAAAGLALAEGDRLELGAGAQATLALPDGTHVALGPATALAITEDGPIRRLAVTRGTVDADVAAQPPDGALVFETPHARATVLGTRLTLEVGGAQTRLSVAHGRVLFERLLEGGAIEVSAQQSALATVGAPVERPAPRAGRPAASSPDTVFAFDLDSGVLPPIFHQGQIVSDGCRPGRRFCLIGTVKPGELASTNLVAVSRSRPELFAFTETTVVAFDYWVGADARELSLQLWDADRRQNYSLHLPDFVRERWAHAEIRVRELKPHLYPDRPMEDGDRIENMFVFSGRTGGKPFYVQDLRVIDYPPGLEPRRSATRPLDP